MMIDRNELIAAKNGNLQVTGSKLKTERPFGFLNFLLIPVILIMSLIVKMHASKTWSILQE